MTVNGNKFTGGDSSVLQKKKQYVCFVDLKKKLILGNKCFAQPECKSEVIKWKESTDPAVSLFHVFLYVEYFLENSFCHSLSNIIFFKLYTLYVYCTCMYMYEIINVIP